MRFFQSVILWCSLSIGCDASPCDEYVWRLSVLDDIGITKKAKFVRFEIWDTKSFEVAVIGLVAGGEFEGELKSHLVTKFFVYPNHRGSRIIVYVVSHAVYESIRPFISGAQPSTSTGLMADWSVNRASHRVPGHRASPAHRGQPHAQALPHAHLCAQPCRGQVSVLVLLDSAQEGQEGQR